MRAGALDRRVTLQRATFAPGAFNEPEATWEDLGRPWAAMAAVSDRERHLAAERGAEITHRFTIRRAYAWADLNPKDRLLSGGRVYDIEGVKEVDRDALEITANARVDQ
ncbi:phage head closure protein [Rhodovulum sp. DZ06]|uniref:phage head closure protein n=1 Tax=Rhodovulum sp. DZ06 TaxID=3425126 RepID=UPI003D3316C2